MFRRRRFVVSLVFVVLAACLADEKTLGFVAGYGRSYPEPVVLEMPQNAPSITQQFRSPRATAQLNGIDPHLGIDVHAPIGTPVLAAAGGVVERSFWGPAYGNQVQVLHAADSSGKESRTRYVHLKKRLVEAGAVVERGQQLGELGITGFLSSGFPHLHFELIYQGTALGHSSADPNLYWAKGKGKITCWDPKWQSLGDRELKLTYPVPCK